MSPELTWDPNTNRWVPATRPLSAAAKLLLRTVHHAHRRLNDRDAYRAAGRPWPTPTSRRPRITTIEKPRFQ